MNAQMRTLALTSPRMHGHDVEVVQVALKDNWTHVDYLHGPADSDFGPESARACIRAKHWLGYPTGDELPIAGPRLLDLLQHRDHLPALYRLRRQRRLHAQAQTPLRVKALARAERDLGMKENPPGSNQCPITKRWGLIGPWCNMAVSEWYLDAGSKAFLLGRDWAYVPAFLAAAELGQHGLAVVRSDRAQPGDAVCFDWDKDGIPDHVGLLRTKVDRVGRFETIEGNTAIGNDSNGGQVMHRTRQLEQVSRYQGAPAFVHVGR